jgi:hypothetical protein
VTVFSRRDTMKAKKKSGSTKGKSSGKRAVKDLPARKGENVRGGAVTLPYREIEWTYAKQT